MRLSAELLQSAEQRTNPLGEREIILRSLAIPAIEHLSVTRDAFDSIDLSNNHISKLENFPKLNRLSCLHLGGNEIHSVDAKNIRKNLPELKNLVLTGNRVKGWNNIGDLGIACPKLELLSLVGNPVTKRQHYRLYTIHKLPTLKILDFIKVKKSERERAQRFASSAAGAALEADARTEARISATAAAAVTSLSEENSTFYAPNGENGLSHTFEPGEGKSVEESFITQFTLEEKAMIRDMVANAASAEEIDRIENMVKRGIFPGTLTNNEEVQVRLLSAPPPPPSLSEEETNALSRGKRSTESDDDGDHSKRQRIE